MKCPHCNATITDSAFAAQMGARGGSKGKRRLSPETARQMQRKSAATRKANRKAKMDKHKLLLQRYREATLRLYSELVDVEMPDDTDVTLVDGGAMVTVQIWVPESEIEPL